MTRPRAVRLALVCAAGLAVPAVPAAGQLPCDSAASSPIAYQFRGDRCEGVYARDVSGSSSLAVHSLTAFLEDFDPRSGVPVEIRWRLPDSTAAVRLRALPVRFRVHYAMETIKGVSGGRYRWPMTVLARAGVQASDIGIVGTTTLKIGGRDREVFLPLIVTQRSVAPPNKANAQYTLVLYPEVDVASAFLTVRRLDDKGAPISTEIDARALGSFVAEARMRVAVPRPNAPGVYQVHVGATLANGAAANAVLWLYVHD
jgi:hypothetical protein